MNDILDLTSPKGASPTSKFAGSYTPAEINRLLAEERKARTLRRQRPVGSAVTATSVVPHLLYKKPDYRADYRYLGENRPRLLSSCSSSFRLNFGSYSL